MERDDFYLNILIGVIAGLIVLLGSFVGETIENTGLRIGVTIAMPLLLFVIFVKVLQRKFKKK